MRVAALYDIHGNLPALEAVLDEVRRVGVDHVVVGGDVLPGPMPRETLDRLLDLGVPTHFIHGNGESAVLAVLRGEEPVAVPEPFRDIIRWNADQLTPEQGRLLRDWPLTFRLPVPGLGDVLFCHATPRNDTDIFTRVTPAERLVPLFEPHRAAVAVVGHTHMPFDRTVGTTRVVNPGSVGMPFGEPGAYWLLLGPDVQLRRTDYDREAAAKRLRATAYPQADDFAAKNVLHPPPEADMLERFEGVALR